MNLAESRSRDVAQLKQLARRSSIVPERRDTRAPSFQPAADLRSARRGDGGAQELMQTLGLVQRGAASFQEYAQNKHGADEAENIAQGAADQQTGNVDPEFMEKSDGYRNAVTKGRTMSYFDDATQEFAPVLEELLERQDDPSLEVRRAQVSERIERFYHEFTLDEETGELKEFMRSPGAMRYLADAVQKTRGQFEGAAMRRIEERFQREAFGHFNKSFATQAKATGQVDLNAARTLLPPGVSDEDIADNTIVALFNAVDALKADGRVEEATRLAASLRGYVNKPVDAGLPAAFPTGTATPATGGRVGFDNLASAVEFVESRGNPNAVSPKGARGRMQTMPGTLRDPGYGVKPAQNNSDAELSRVGRDYLKAMLREYGGDLVLALAAYNWGPGRVDEWKDSVAGKSTVQKIAAIPVKETREYVKKVMDRAGASSAPETAPASAPQFRLTNPHADPVTLAEQSGQIAPIIGLEGTVFSPEQQARINQTYSATTEAMRREWKAAREEEQTKNGESLAMGVMGLEDRVTTQQDILSALDQGAIDGGTAMSLHRMLEAKSDREEAKADAAAGRIDREQSRAEKRALDAALGELVADVSSGRLSPAAARTKAMRVAGTLPVGTQQAYLGGSLSIANNWESGIMGNEASRAHATIFEQRAGSAETTIRGWKPLQSQVPALSREFEQIVDKYKAQYGVRVINGEDQQKVYAEITQATALEIAALKERATRHHE